MNVLLFVISMILLMTAMTYSRIESYRGFALMQSQFEFYMRTLERADYNSSAWQCYHANPATQKEEEDNEKEEKATGSAKLSFKIFVDKKEREASQQRYLQFSMIAKNLLNALYGHTKFLKDSLAKDEGVIDRLLVAIGDESAKLTAKEKISSLCDLSRIKFQDEDLQFIFYNMLEGGVEIPKEERGTLKLQKSYPKLGNYLTMQNKTQIRVYLASRPLLLALFGEEEIVDEIIQKRKELFAEVDKQIDAMPVAEAKAQFQNQFEGRRIHGLISEMLDFTVSKTNPSGYE